MTLSDGHAATSFSGWNAANGFHELQSSGFMTTGGHTLTVKCLRQSQDLWATQKYASNVNSNNSDERSRRRELRKGRLAKGAWILSMRWRNM